MLFGIIMSAYLQFGYLSGSCFQQEVYYYGSSHNIDFTYIEQNPFYGEFGVQFEKDFFIKEYKITPFFDTSINTMMVPEVWNNWHPTQNYYKIGGGIKFNDNIEIGFHHTCYHPSAAYSYVKKYMIRDSFEGGTNEAYIKFGISNRGKK